MKHSQKKKACLLDDKKRREFLKRSRFDILKYIKNEEAKGEVTIERELDLRRFLLISLNNILGTIETEIEKIKLRR